LNSRERVLKAINFEEPDMVPIGELAIDLSLMEKILDVKKDITYSSQSALISDRAKERSLYDIYYKTYRKIGLDLIYCISTSLPDNYELKKLPNGQLMDELGRTYTFDPTSKTQTVTGTVFNTEEDVEKFLEYDFPDPEAPGRDYGLRHLKKINQETMALGFHIREPFAQTWEALTPVKFVYWMHKNPSLVKNFIDKLTDFNIQLIKILCQHDLDIIIMGGDLCEAKGPMLPPDKFKSLGVFDGMRRQVETAHRYNTKFIKHTDGFVDPLLDDLLDIAKIDGLHSLDPSAGVDIGEIKKNYGDSLILHGNISVDNLATKSPEEIIEETKNVIKVASPNGGHILSSSNSWYGGGKLENYLAMVETGRKYGKYPIAL
jgi:uroporphyrinogen decarboxylase